LHDANFLTEIEILISKDLKVDKENGTIEFPIEYIKNNITEGEISGLKYHFRDIESKFKDNPLYIENKDLIDKFKEDYCIKS
jgi:hypothetical protein